MPAWTERRKKRTKFGGVTGLWCKSDPGWRELRKFGWKVQQSRQVLLRLPGMGNWIPTLLSYWWEAVHGRHGLKADAGMNFWEQPLRPLVTYVPCSRRQRSHDQNIWVLDDEKDLIGRRGKSCYEEVWRSLHSSIHLVLCEVSIFLVRKESGISELSCEHIYQSAVNKHGHLIFKNPLTCFGFLV